MKNLKHALTRTPELYLVITCIYYWTLTASALNPIAIILIIALILQVLFKNKISGIVISVFFIILNLFMVLAFLSEFYEFPSLNADAKRLAIFGSLYLGLNLIIATIMLIKYLRLKASQVQTRI